MVSALNRLVPVLLCLAGLQGQALAARLDDSLSPRRQVDLELQWKYQGNTDSLSDAEFNAVTAQARNLDTRLDTSAYVGSEARIFLELPILVRGLGNPSSLLLSWTTGGLFNAGRVTPGNRTLIYEGSITQAVMRDTITFTFELDARYLHQPLRLEPVYEIEIITP
jgi:hypothetical protein